MRRLAQICAFLLPAGLLAVSAFSAAPSRGLDEARQIAEKCHSIRQSVGFVDEGFRQILCLRGELDNKMFDAVQLRLAPRFRALNVVVDSPGGSVTFGLKLANSLGDQGYNLIVTNDCFSSCANYLFPAANKKFILSGAQIGWHGTTAPRSFDDYLQIFRQGGDELSARERSLLRKHYNNQKQAQATFAKRFGFAEALFFDHWRAYHCVAGPGGWGAFQFDRRKKVATAFWRPSGQLLEARYRVGNVFAEDPQGIANNIVLLSMTDKSRQEVLVPKNCFGQRV